MLTKIIWFNNYKKGDLIYDILLNEKRCTEKDIAFHLMFNIVVTPLTIILDLIFLPLEIFYLIILFFVNRYYKNKEYKHFREILGGTNE